MKVEVAVLGSPTLLRSSFMNCPYHAHTGVLTGAWLRRHVPAIRHGPLEQIDPVSQVNGIFLLVRRRLRSSICSNNVVADS